jgi:Flp pilus assembly protein TadB
MSDTDPEVTAQVQDRVRHVVARSVLRRLAHLSSSMEAQDRADALLLKRVAWALAGFAVSVVLLVLVLSAVPEVSLLAVTVIVGVALGVGMIFRSKRRGRDLQLDRSSPGERGDRKG